MDQDTQQLDGNNSMSEATPGITPEPALDATSDTGHGEGHAMPPEASAAKESAATAPPEPVSSMSDEERKAALEAIIYAADEPATIEQLAKALGEPKAAVQVALDELVASYASDSRGIEIRGVAGGYKMYTKPQHHDLVRRFIKSLRPPLRLTMPALETLAVISYKQPVTAPEIQEIRGVNTSGVIKTLLDKKLITTAGRKEVIGRPILYRTSKEFLMRFGLSDLGELPSLKEFEALAREALGTDEGVADSNAGDESVLDAMEPTEAEAAAELEAAASESPAEEQSLASSEAIEAQTSTKEAITDQQFESSAPVTEAITEQPVEGSAIPEPEARLNSMDAVAEVHQAPGSHESAEVQPQQAEAVAEAQQTPEFAAMPTAEAEQEPEPVSAQSESAEPVFAESEPTHAIGMSIETPHSPEPVAEFESADHDSTEHEVSDEILAQLAQGIEIEVSADSLAGLSADNVPTEEAPTQFYSSDAEPERQPPTAAETPEHSNEHPSSESKPATEQEKSRKAAAGE